jgi:hypothetical protein
MPAFTQEAHCLVVESFRVNGANVVTTPRAPNAARDRDLEEIRQF